MLHLLKKHPFAVEAFFTQSLVITYAIPKEQVRHLVPECLELDTHNDKWAFIAVAMVQTRDLRPKGLPAWMGQDFFLIGYRVFVRYTTLAGKNLRGLYILRSQTDKQRMSFFGNLFTHYKYTTTDILQREDVHLMEFSSKASDFKVAFSKSLGETNPLPEGSPFKDWKEARRFAGPLPFTFTWDPKRKEVLIIEGVREHWKPEPVQLLAAHFSFLDDLHLEGAVQANAFVIRDVPYYWKKGRTEPWPHNDDLSRVSSIS